MTSAASQYRTETEKVSAQFAAANFVRKIDQGQTKEAAAVGSAFIRQKLRQEAAVREILPPVLLADDELDRNLESDEPMKIVEKEPNSTATFVPFYGSAERQIFSGPRYRVSFGKISSDRFRKSKFELMSYQNDIRKILSDNAVKDMAEQEDAKFIETLEFILAAAPGQVVAAPAFNSSAFKVGMQNLSSRKKPIGKAYMTEIAYYETLDLPYTAVGQVAARHYDDGTSAQKEVWGLPVVTTIHNNLLLPRNGATHSIYLFAPENWLGNFFLLQDATLFIKQEEDIIKFHAYEALGIGIGATDAFTRIDVA